MKVQTEEEKKKAEEDKKKKEQEQLREAGNRIRRALGLPEITAEEFDPMNPFNYDWYFGPHGPLAGDGHGLSKATFGYRSHGHLPSRSRGRFCGSGDGFGGGGSGGGVGGGGVAAGVGATNIVGFGFPMGPMDSGHARRSRRPQRAPLHRYRPVPSYR